MTQEPEFNLERAGYLVAETISLLASFYPDGALEWLRTERPDVIRSLAEAEEAVDVAVLTGSKEHLVRALEVYTKRHRRAFDIYAARPAVIDCQASPPAPPAAAAIQ